MKRRRSAPKGRPTKRSKVVPASVVFPGPGRQQMMFVPRSFGNPRAITERKYFDTNRTAMALSDAVSTWAGAEADPATLLSIFQPVTGDDFLNRDGRKVQVFSIKLRGTITVAAQTNAAAADGAAMIRILLVQDKQTNGAQLNAEDVLGTGGGVAYTGQAINAFQNPAFFGRFRVLKDRKFALQNPNMTYDGTNIEQAGLIKQFKMNIKFKKPVVVHFNATNGGTIADIIDNSFHVIAGTNSTDMAPSIGYLSRVTFIDL